MSIETLLERHIAALEANTAALLTVAGAAAATPAKADKPKAEKQKAEKPAKTPQATQPAAEIATDGFDDEPTGSDDGFGEEEAADAPRNTPDQAKAAFLALRDAAIAAKGKDDGLKVAKAALAETALGSVNDIPADKADEVVRIALNHAVIAKVGPKFKELAKAAGVVI